MELDKLSTKNAETIGSNIGDTIQIDDIMRPKCLDRSYMRIKLVIDATKPLVAGF